MEPGGGPGGRFTPGNKGSMFYTIEFLFSFPTILISAIMFIYLQKHFSVISSIELIFLAYK